MSQWSFQNLHSQWEGEKWKECLAMVAVAPGAHTALGKGPWREETSELLKSAKNLSCVECSVHGGWKSKLSDDSRRWGQPNGWLQMPVSARWRDDVASWETVSAPRQSTCVALKQQLSSWSEFKDVSQISRPWIAVLFKVVITAHIPLRWEQREGPGSPPAGCCCRRTQLAVSPGSKG